MKKSNSNTKAQIFRSAFYLLLLLAICAMTFALAKPSFGGLTTSATPSKQTGTLSFAERVAYQRAIEEVYGRHRIWPAVPGSAGLKPALEKIMSQAQIEAKVGEYLRNSELLTDTGIARSRPSSSKPRWSEWRGTQNSRKFFGNCLRLLEAIPLLLLSAWPGRC